MKKAKTMPWNTWPYRVLLYLDKNGPTKGSTIIEELLKTPTSPISKRLDATIYGAIINLTCGGYIDIGDDPAARTRKRTFFINEQGRNRLAELSPF